RVAIGRAIVREPKLFLFDEPLASLDAKLRETMILEIHRLQRRLNVTMLYVTHDQTEAMTLATRVGVLEQGRLVQLGTPRQIYEDPVSSYVASRLGAPRINLVPRAALGSLQAPASAVTAGIRAEHLQFASTGCAAQVRRIERLSDQHLVHLALAGSEHELISAAPAGTNVEPGAAVFLQIGRPLWFDAAGLRITS
ncbi:MAG: ABC transporter ATP-binding protein, partial [Rhizobacter sp.]